MRTSGQATHGTLYRELDDRNIGSVRLTPPVPSALHHTDIWRTQCILGTVSKVSSSPVLVETSGQHVTLSLALYLSLLGPELPPAERKPDQARANARPPDGSITILSPLTAPHCNSSLEALTQV
ncbi:uncharacterized protein SPSK_03736 [Sporothrix schenckii 1099-18]|uniref:Uncharacterized protein n=1 Tax=Sporothrix schenckii 1099-18 TaxID=1397361 RepID=A0A0F2M096_SPOSC|nr:uncharacterized protein SPSK_03736 [Sporothrix schenckii 1099-18]KJR82185.1 hypothetical protein SPSK_03736 [Sporothrix schenckii 1099-18]